MQLLFCIFRFDKLVQFYLHLGYSEVQILNTYLKCLKILGNGSQIKPFFLAEEDLLAIKRMFVKYLAEKATRMADQV